MHLSMNTNHQQALPKPARFLWYSDPLCQLYKSCSKDPVDTQPSAIWFYDVEVQAVPPQVIRKISYETDMLSLPEDIREIVVLLITQGPDKVTPRIKAHSDNPRPGKERHRHQHNKQNLQARHKIQHTPVIMINNKDSSTILPSNLRIGQEIRIFYCNFRAEQHIISYSYF